MDKKRRRSFITEVYKEPNTDVLRLETTVEVLGKRESLEGDEMRIPL